MTPKTSVSSINRKEDLGSTSDAYEGSYDPADFIIPAQDVKGHSERIWVRIQPGHDRQLDIVKNCGKFPFRTKGDIVRWCLSEGLKRLERMEEMPSVMAQVDVIGRIVNNIEWDSQFLTTFDKMQTPIRNFLADGAIGQARKMVAETKAAMDRMPKGYWRDRYMSKLDSEYGYLLEPTNGNGNGNGNGHHQRSRQTTEADGGDEDQVTHDYDQ